MSFALDSYSMRVLKHRYTAYSRGSSNSKGAHKLQIDMIYIICILYTNSLYNCTETRLRPSPGHTVMVT